MRTRRLPQPLRPEAELPARHDSTTARRQSIISHYIILTLDLNFNPQLAFHHINPKPNPNPNPNPARAGTLNGFFVLARTVGLIGHALDQNRMGEGLYRHPWEDILYTA